VGILSNPVPPMMASSDISCLFRIAAWVIRFYPEAVGIENAAENSRSAPP
jgi:hypothetical protein